MITVAQAEQMVLNAAKPLRTVTLPLDQAHDAVLAKSIRTDTPIPRFSSSAVDGYAVRASDLAAADTDSPIMIQVKGESAAGTAPGSALERGTAMRIFTGAMIPDGADAVLMQEHVQRQGSNIVVNTAPLPAANVRPIGDEYVSGAIALEAGSVLSPAALGLLAALGYARVPVTATPLVSLIVTGSELLMPGATLRTGALYDANSFSLSAVLNILGAQVCCYRVEDKLPQLREALADALRESDVVITTGGVSVGEYDYIPEVLTALRVKKMFHNVALKPGKPVYFGTRASRLIFGLPGNPVSVLMTAFLFLRPAIAALRGLSSVKKSVMQAHLSETLQKRPGRLECISVRVRNQDGTLFAIPLEKQGSHMLSSMTEADGFIRFPAEKKLLKKGAIVSVERFDWRLT